MGVPKFYRWLSERYPLLNQAVDETSLLPEFDNLYLDMNGIIHNATHGNDGVSKALSEKDVVLTMMAYIDNMVKIIKPRKLLYMAIDGVAPRAKMNQQRSRRFRAARDLEIAKKEAAAKGEKMEDGEVFDSNCITPGTVFMDSLGKHLQYFIRLKIKLDPMWQRMRVIFSGHNVPGEGEHKIVQFIRGAKLRADWDPNTRHCMAGLDADLIMLSLATHEPHFSLLREQVDFKAFQKNPHGTKTKTRATAAVKWQLLHVGLLREYLEVDMRPSHPLPPTFDGGRGFDGERVVDDFVLIMALCGNDFTPHLPSLDIGEGAIDHLLRVYREKLGGWGGYLCTEGLIHFGRVEQLLAVMGAMEAEVFKARAEEAESYAKRARKDAAKKAQLLGYMEEGGGGGGGVDEEDGEGEASADDITAQAKAAAEAEMLAAVAARLAAERSEEEGGAPVPAAPFTLQDGDFKGRYYLEKFGITYKRGSSADAAVLGRIVRSFAEALQWVMLYYYRGVPSWGWFYPFHFAPMTSDLTGLAAMDLTFKLGQPFKPFQQLLGCLPAASAKFLPDSYAALMTDSASPLLEYYPPVAAIKVDMNGKRNSWEGVTLIPFIREKDMLEAIAAKGVDAKLSEAEARRNSFGVEYCYWHDPSALDTVVSTKPDLFQPIQLCQSRAVVQAIPRLPVLTSGLAPVPRPAGPGGGVAEAYSVEEDPERDQVIAVAAGMSGSAHLFSCRPPVGCTIPAPGFPSLHTLPFTPMRMPAHMDVFGMKSRKDSIILAVSNGRRSMEEEEEAEDEAMLAVAGAFAEEGEGGAPGPSTTTGSTTKRVVPTATPPHLPIFSVKYAPGTSVADGPAATARDLLSTLTASLPGGGTTRVRARHVAPAILGKTLYAEWPHLREVLVVGVCDGEEEALWSGATSSFGDDVAGQGAVLHRALTVDAQVEWERASEDLRRCLLGGGRGLNIAGVRVGDIPFTVTVRKLEGMRRDPASGALTRVFAAPGSPGEVRIAPQLLLPGHPCPDARYQEQGPAVPALRFPVGCAVIPLRGAVRGATAVVAGYVAADGSTPSRGQDMGDRLVIDAEVPPPEPPFGHTIHATIQDKYFDTKRAAAALRISPSTLGRITGSVIVLPDRWDLGLNLKVHRTLFLPGYVRSTSSEAQSPAWAAGSNSSAIASAAPQGAGGDKGGWEYTERAIALVAAYMQAHPSVIAMLEECPNESAYHVRDLPGRLAALLKVCTWLKQLDTAKRPLVPISTAVMSPPAVQAVQKAADAFAVNVRKRAAAASGKEEGDPSVKVTKSERLAGVPAHDLYRAEEQSYAVGGVGEGEGVALASLNVDGPTMVPSLGDRVANLSFKSAPLGLRGTVVGVHAGSGYVEALFDSEFVGGTTLGGMCGNGRGGLVPWSALLCLSRTPSESAAPARSAARVGTVAGSAAQGGPAGSRAHFDAAAVQTAAGGAEGGREKQQHRQEKQASAPRQAAAAVARAPAPAPVPAPAAGGKLTPGGRVAAGPAHSGGTGFNRKAAAPAPAPAPAVAPSPSPPAAAAAMVAQVEFYFSDGNLGGDKFMREQFGKDSSGQGWVQLQVIASFKRMKELAGGDPAVIAAALRAGSSALQVSPDGSAVKRVVPWKPTLPGKDRGAKAAAPAQAPAAAAPSAAALFATMAAASAPALTQPMPMPAGAAMPMQAQPMDMATYWRVLMAQQAAGAAPVAQPVPLIVPQQAAPAPTATPQQAPAGPVSTGSSAFDQLVANLNKSRLG